MRLALVCLALLCLAGCSKTPAPEGRWEGAYDAGDVIVAARLETTADASVRVSAPDAIGIAAPTEAERDVIRTRLAEGLAQGWDSVDPRKMDFDGKVFRKPGGVAPQMEWNPQTRSMTLVVYLGTQTIRIPMRAVKQFSDNPFAPWRDTPGEGAG